MLTLEGDSIITSIYKLLLVILTYSNEDGTYDVTI